MELFFIVLLIYPMTARWGLVGTSASILTATLLPIAIACIKAVKSLDGRLIDFGRILLFPITNSLVMGLIVHFSVGAWQGFFFFFLKAFLGIGLYCLFTYFCFRTWRYDVGQLIFRIWKDAL
jgi:hypothetical protein